MTQTASQLGIAIAGTSLGDKFLEVRTASGTQSAEFCNHFEAEAKTIPMLAVGRWNVFFIPR